MQRRRLLTILSAALLAPALALPAAAAASGGAHASIIGGNSATIEQFSFLAFIEAGNAHRGFSCTGTVVAPRVVLTAAHCAEDIETGGFTEPGEYAVATSVANPKQARAENVFSVSAVHVFPSFDPGAIHGDAAVLILSRPTSAAPIALAGPEDAPLYSGGAAVTVAGWGLTRAQNRQAPANMRSATMAVQTPSGCRRKTRGFYKEFSPSVQLCLLSPPANKSGTCFGDSGGPAIGQRPDGTMVELGVISVVGPLCTPQAPNVLTRVDYVSPWVAEWIAATEAGAPEPFVDPAAQTPAMKKSVAEEFAVYTLLNAFGERFESLSRIVGGCRKVSRTRYRCEIAWITSHTIYAGTVTPFFVRRRQTNTWDSHYLVRWIPRHCATERTPAPSCRIHSKRS